jgi:hypothetical protein
MKALLGILLMTYFFVLMAEAALTVDKFGTLADVASKNQRAINKLHGRSPAVAYNKGDL